MGGGITPDMTIAGRPDDPWFAFVTQRGYMTSYAESYLTTHGKLAEPFEVSPEMLEISKTPSGATACAFPMSTGQRIRTS